MAQKITHLLLVTLILTLGFGQLLRFELFGVPIYLHDVLVIFILLFNSRTLLVGNPARRVLAGSLGAKLLFLGLTLGALQALFLYPLSTLLIPLLYTLRLIAYFSLYFSLKAQNLPAQAGLEANYFLLSGAIATAIGLAQYFLMPDMRMFQYLGWDDHLNRVTLPHFDPTFSSVFFVLTGLLAFETKHYFLSLLTLPAILLSYARSTWLSLVIVFFTKSKFRLVIVICLLLIPIFFLPHKMGEGTNLLRTYSISSRLSHDFSLLKSTGWHSLLGVGYNTLAIGQSHATGANNTYLEIFLTTGVLGLIGSLLLLLDFARTFPYPSIFTFVLFASLFNNILLYPFVLLYLILLATTSPSGVAASPRPRSLHGQ